VKRCAAFLLAVALALGKSHGAGGDDDSLPVIEKATFALVNEARKDDGLPPLTWDADVARIARQHSRDMASGDVGFGHSGFHQRVGELRKLNANYRASAENVFMSSRPFGVADQAVYAWLHSPGHAANIHGDYGRSGLGVARASNGFLYFTQVFLKVVPAPQDQ
jgi:uncharacterized protein YkwD